jgi:hypothetical protein
MIKLLDFIVNKAHMILGASYASMLAGYCLKTGHDIGPGLASATYAFYGFLLGHAGVYQKWPDKDGGDGNPS